MAKMGILHDYDLMANREESAQKPSTCVVCDTSPVIYQWSDYHGEGMCCQCGCPYQLRAGSEEQVKEGDYPYLSMLDSFVPIAREFWQAQKRFVHYGMSLSNRDGMDALTAWLKVNHPEHFKQQEAAE